MLVLTLSDILVVIAGLCAVGLLRRRSWKRDHPDLIIEQASRPPPVRSTSWGTPC